MTPAFPAVLGVDPGSRSAGWAVVVGPASRPRLVACGAIVLSPRLPLERRLATLYDELRSVARDHAPASAAVEAPFHGASARAALQLAHARGVVLAALGAAAVPVEEYAPATIKKAVTGSGRAEKVQVLRMVRALVRDTREFESADVSDAVAIALCHLFHDGVLRRLSEARTR